MITQSEAEEMYERGEVSKCKLPTGAVYFVYGSANYDLICRANKVSNPLSEWLLFCYNRSRMVTQIIGTPAAAIITEEEAVKFGL